MHPHITHQKGKDSPQDGKKNALREPVTWPLTVIAVVVMAAFLGVLYHYVFVAPGQPSDRRIAGTVTKPPPGLPDQWPYNTKEWQSGWNAGLAVGPDGKTKFGGAPHR